jgi:hypothetical protein
MNIRTSRDLLAAVTVAAAATGANAQLEKLLIVDLSVENEITITATAGLAGGSVSGSDGTGVLLADFFDGLGPAIFDSAGVGDLTSANEGVSDGSPALFNSSASAGLNVWSYVGGTTSFSAGSQAFQGSATWSLDPDEYVAALAGNSSGTIYAIADTDDDIAGATAIGTWNVIPAPASAALLGLGGLAAVRRRR